ncbi:MAG: 16S rRNA (guanine(527)-N(7))-methyltransferase RsmG [Sideroxydans sp.]|jgi:16S rRNA (guanine527-N7)-methyltransferase
MSAEAILRKGLAEIGLELDADTQRKLLAYLVLMRKWNKTYNLTAISDENEMVVHHLLDALGVLPYLWSGRWLDVGCGAGVPGAILAIAKPEWGFTLLDSNRKKTSFVQQAVIELDISNVKVHTGRVEDWETPDRFDGIISRAFADLGKFIQLTEHLLAERGCWAAMKGRLEDGLPQDCKVVRRIQIHVPGLSAARSLVIVAKLGE